MHIDSGAASHAEDRLALERHLHADAQARLDALKRQRAQQVLLCVLTFGSEASVVGFDTRVARLRWESSLLRVPMCLAVTRMSRSCRTPYSRLQHDI